MVRPTAHAHRAAGLELAVYRRRARKELAHTSMSPTHALSPKSASSSSRRAKHATCTTKAALKIKTESCAITVATGSHPCS